MEYSVPYYLGASGIAVHTKMVKNYERSWNIFADTRFTDRMVMMDDMREVLGDALAHLGYSVNTKDPAELAKARDLVDKKWKPNLVKFDAEGFAKAFASGEYWVSHGYAEAIFEEMSEKEWGEVDFFLPEEGAVYIVRVHPGRATTRWPSSSSTTCKPENYASCRPLPLPRLGEHRSGPLRTTSLLHHRQLKNYELKRTWVRAWGCTTAPGKIRYVN